MYIYNHLRTKGICEKAAGIRLWLPIDVPDQYKTQEMCDAVVREDFSSLQLVPDWSMT